MSPVHVDELTSEVVAEPEPDSGAESAAPADEEDRFRAMRDRLARDAARTRAEGFDD